MNSTELRNWVETEIDAGTDSDKIFYKFRAAYPDEHVNKEITRADGKKITLRTHIEGMAEELTQRRDVLIVTPLGQRYYDLHRARLQFKLNLMISAQERLPEIESVDPGDDPKAIDIAYQQIMKIETLLQRLDTARPEEESGLIMAMLDEAPEHREKAHELYPLQIPKY